MLGPRGSLVVARVFAFVDNLILVELIATLLRAMLFWWCTSGRFNHPLQSCRLCGESGMDQQVHYLSCSVTTRSKCKRMLCAHTPERLVEHRFFMEQIGCAGSEALRVVVTLDAALHAFDA